MKKFFEIPDMEITLFAVEDVITTSGDPITPPGENETPDW